MRSLVWLFALALAPACVASPEPVGEPVEPPVIGGKLDDVAGPVVLPTFADGPEEQEAILLRSSGYRTNSVEVGIDGPYDFCVGAPPTTEMGDAFGFELANAHLLAAVAANQYVHYAKMARYLVDLGFGTDEEARLWRDRAVLVQLMRIYETPLDERESLAADAERELSSFVAQQRVNGTYRTSAELERDFLQTPTPGLSIQFFSAGSIQPDGTFLDHSTQVVFARHRDLPISVLAFRGTQEPLDFVLDADGRQRVFTGGASWGYVHQGFQTGFESVRYQVMSTLYDDAAGTEVWMTGHSLGGAVATLAAAHALVVHELRQGQAPYRLGGLYTFGSPRVGNPVFADRFMRSASAAGAGIYRVRHADDPVTKVARQGFSLGEYAHVGSLVLLQRIALGGAMEHDVYPPYTAEVRLTNVSPREVTYRDAYPDIEYSFASCLRPSNAEDCFGMHSMTNNYYTRIRHFYFDDATAQHDRLRSCQ